jgi:hypothetical protein
MAKATLGWWQPWGKNSMPYFNQTNSAECSAQIDTIGWMVVMFVVAVATITGIALYVSL